LKLALDNLSKLLLFEDNLYKLGNNNLEIMS